MKTPDEIKKGLECCTSGICQNDACPYNSIKTMGACTELLMMDALTHIHHLEAENIELEKHIGEIIERAQEWISIEDELPAEDDTYLICLEDGYVATAYFEDGEFDLWADATDVAYWMPLPKAPVVKKDETAEMPGML